MLFTVKLFNPFYSLFNTVFSRSFPRKRVFVLNSLSIGSSAMILLKAKKVLSFSMEEVKRAILEAACDLFLDLLRLGLKRAMKGTSMSLV